MERGEARAEMLSESQNCGVCNILHTPTTCFRTTAPTLGNSSDAWNTALRRGRQRQLNTMIVSERSNPSRSGTKHSTRRGALKTESTEFVFGAGAGAGAGEGEAGEGAGPGSSGGSLGRSLGNSPLFSLLCTNPGAHLGWVSGARGGWVRGVAAGDPLGGSGCT